MSIDTLSPVYLSTEQARAIYTRDNLKEIAKFIFKDDVIPGKELDIERAYPCLNENNEIEFLEVFFNADNFNDNKYRSRVIWWNGKHLKAKGAVVGLYGRDLLNSHPDSPVLMLCDIKSRETARALVDFVTVTWSGGADVLKRVNFTPLSGRRVYIYPDNGEKTAVYASKMLSGIASDIIIIKPLPETRDIADALEIKPPRELSTYILSHTPPVNQPKSNDPYIRAGLFLAEHGFLKIYDKKSIGFYSLRENRAYNYSEIRDKFAEDTISGINPAKAAKMIDNLDIVYPVYNLIKSFGYMPRYIGQSGNKNEYIINRWEGFSYPLKTAPSYSDEILDDVEFVKKHIKNIICGGNEEDYNYLCKWIAHLLQRPDIKPGVAVFAHSEVQGTGKSIIFEQLIPNILGIDITRVFSNEEQIAEKFNAWLFESLYVVFSEQSFYGNTENIKSWITDPNQSRRDMGLESRQERSFARFVICTNKESAFKFEESERRMFVLSVSSSIALEIGDVKWKYFNRLGKAVNHAQVIDCIARFFCSIDISDFNPFDIPDSKKKRDIIEAEKHPIIDFFETVVFGEDPACQITACSEINVDEKTYFDNKTLYTTLIKICKNDEFFIERKKLYNLWRDTNGRNYKITMNKFTRIIKNHYTLDKIEIIDTYVWDSKKSKRVSVIIIKQPFFKAIASK